MSAISINNVSFNYSGNQVLTDINADIPYGKIYCLLGPSGAGKTTLLRLILGRIKPCNGSIKVMGKEPGKNNRSIGYMPQDTALCMTFTVEQTLQYFANIYRLSSKTFWEKFVKKRFLKKILNLPEDDLKLRNYQNISVVIVTHYIEEAALGHIVGIMRDGTILEEGSPKKLVQKYEQKTLEDVFMHICTFGRTNQLNYMNDNEETSIAQLYAKEEPKIDHVKEFPELNTKTFQALILCTLYNRNEIPVHTAVFIEEPEPYYSKQILDSIQKVDVYYLNPIYYNSLDDAVNAIHHGNAVGALWFSRNFSDSLESRINDQDIDNFTLNSSTIKLFVDNSGYLFSNGFVDSVRQTVYNFLSSLESEKNLLFSEAPIKIEEILYAKDSKLTDFLLPGYLICFIYLSQVSLSSQLLIQEKKDGLFERSLVADVGHNLIFLSHFLSSCILSVIQITLMLIFSLVIFNITNYGSYRLIFVLVFCQAASAISTGLLISSIIDQGFVAILAAIFVTFSQLFSSGSVFPMEMVRPSLRQFFYFCPIALPAESLRNAMLRGWHITHPYVYNGLAVNIGSGLLFAIVASIIFKRFS
ncbi:hypothetical protein RDWZM_007461 [Blomia tropicalis]|uniref:Uncharacterized protein n=1 Tax=Blomia tropicalis TaxID=40697 RepID=A0A9Q0LZT7_BLOTA|nr:hypothetical protein RDWZM_007461 [Blomia tropicalis]